MAPVEAFIVELLGGSAGSGPRQATIHRHAGGFSGKRARAPGWRDGCDDRSSEPYLTFQGIERSAVMILAFAVAVVAAATLGCLNLVSWARG
jgi:predicted short-subunit dehydrogenase-like oxidoreductase (DUF2520 family)